MAKYELRQDTLKIGTLERAVGIILQLRLRPADAKRTERICRDTFGRPVEMHIRRLLWPLAPDFQSLVPKSDDPLMDLGPKIANMGIFSPACDADILRICCEHIDRRDEIFNRVVTLLTHHPNIVLTSLKERNLLLRRLLDARDYSWNHQDRVLRLISALNLFDVEPEFRQYAAHAIRFIVYCTLSQEDALAELARKTLVEFTIPQWMPLFVSECFCIDYFDVRVVSNVGLALTALLDAGRRHPMEILTPLFSEVILLFPDAGFRTTCFRLLSGFKKTNAGSEHGRLCRERLRKCYCEYTGDALGDEEPKLNKEQSGTTDIIEMKLSDDEFIYPIKCCFQFLTTFDRLSDKESLTELCLKLFSLMPEASLPLLLRLGVSTEQADGLRSRVEDVMDTTRNDAVRADCCAFFRRFGMSERARNILLAIHGVKLITTSALACAFLRCFWAFDREFAIRATKRFLKDLDELEQNELVIRMHEIRDADIHAFCGREINRKYGFVHPERDPSAALRWLRDHRIGVWPVNSSKAFRDVLLKMIKLQGFQRTLRRLDTIEPQTWKFVYAHQEIIKNMKSEEVKAFFRKSEVKLKLKHVTSSSKIFKRRLAFRPPVDTLLTLTSATPALESGKVPNSQISVQNSFRFSNVKFKQRTLDEALEKFPAVASEAKAYAARTGLTYPTKGEVSLQEAIEKFEIKMKALHAICRDFQQIELPLIE
jgi:hypothetical protein